MNGFEQIKSFYSWVFNNPDKIRPTHISLYLFLLNQNNRSMWVEWFKCPYDLAMQGACIGNKNTYYKCLDELQLYGLIEYKKGINNYKAPLIKLIKMYDSEPLTEQVSVPQSEQVSVPQSEPLSVLLNKNTYKLITSNYKTINNNENLINEFILNLSEEKNKDKIDWKELITFFNKCTGKKTKVIPETVKAKFNARLKEGFTKEDIANAIKNCSKDSWHIDTKYQHLTLEFISRADKLDKYSNIAQATTQSTQIAKHDD